MVRSLTRRSIRSCGNEMRRRRRRRRCDLHSQRTSRQGAHCLRRLGLRRRSHRQSLHRRLHHCLRLLPNRLVRPRHLLRLRRRPALPRRGPNRLPRALPIAPCRLPGRGQHRLVLLACILEEGAHPDVTLVGRGVKRTRLQRSRSASQRRRRAVKNVQRARPLPPRSIGSARAIPTARPPTPSTVTDTRSSPPSPCRPPRRLPPPLWVGWGGGGPGRGVEASRAPRFRRPRGRQEHRPSCQRLGRQRCMS